MKGDALTDERARLSCFSGDSFTTIEKRKNYGKA
jgi:hypothetical protein